MEGTERYDKLSAQRTLCKIKEDEIEMISDSKGISSTSETTIGNLEL